MSQNLASLYSRKIEERRTLKSRLEVLEIEIRTLEEAGASPDAAPAVTVPKAEGKGRRAPNGLLERMIVQVLDEKAGMTNGQIRDKVSHAGYKHRLEVQYMAHTLAKLMKKKAVVRDKTPGGMVYRKAAGK